ncbi:trypsin-like serine protease [Mesorhizobium sp. C120A]|uniref:trypsin-like serine protease n=1 Tax=unclassified Mesorhizobium TaxID=325217 RepID=UPI0018CB09EC|nr:MULTISPECIES: trypsin-like serine protease [unclassified Mesorhizobium]WJI42194.1 trypsin-like serine protease [Mesorhizobium sp. C120A]
MTWLLAISMGASWAQEAEQPKTRMNGEYFLQQQGATAPSEPYDPHKAFSAYRVTNGTEVFEGTPVILPEVVKIVFKAEDGSPAFCTGVAVAADRILTAGHCGCGIPESYSVRFLSAPNLSSEDITLDRAPVVFPGFDCIRELEPQPGRDLAVLYLQIAGEDIKPPPIAQMTLPFEGTTARRAFIAGYGRTETGAFPNGLLGAFTPIKDYFCIRGGYAGSPCASFREFVLSDLISSAVPGVDSCDGDSGGPVYWFGKTMGHDGIEEVHRFLIGITSRGLSGVPQYGATSCGGGGIYSVVGHVDVLAWLSVNGATSSVGLNARHFAEDDASPAEQ